MEFTVMCADKPVADIYISEDKKHVKINRLVSDSTEQPFGGDKLDLERVYQFLKGRCYEDGRVDIRTILSSAGLENNNPWEWVKITHGVTWEDFFWIKFPGEDLEWEDVRWHR